MARLPTDEQPWQARAMRSLQAALPASLVELVNAADKLAPSERRQVTVLCLDLADLTVLHNRLDRREAAHLADCVISGIASTLCTYEGALDTLLGDRLIVMFGVSTACEDHADLAVRAALQVDAHLAPINATLLEQHHIDISVKAGIHTGAILTGQMLRSGARLVAEYTAIGDTVALALQLADLASRGATLVSPDILERTRSSFLYETIEPGPTQASVQIDRAYRLKRTLSPRRIRQGSAGASTPMVGRRAGLAQLHAALSQVQHNQRTGIVAITGEAGMGKSRLVAEFKRSLDPDINVFEGACSPHTQSTPLWVISDLVRDILQITASSDQAAQFAEIKERLNRAELGSTLPYLAHILGLEHIAPETMAMTHRLDAAMLQRQTHASLRQVLLAETRQTNPIPTIVILEDLHWVDPASQAAIQFMVQTIHIVPLLFILVCRDSEQEAIIQPLLAHFQEDTDRVFRVQLDPLLPEEEQALIDQFLKSTSGDDQAFKDHISKRAEGNPFYTEEILSMLIDRGALVREADRWRIMPNALQVLREIPGSLGDLILARLNSLPKRARQIVQLAAVLGRSMPLDLLQNMSGESREALTPILQELHAKRFLDPLAARKSTYTFHHALVQEVVYSTLVKRRRSTIHHQAAQAIEQTEFWPPDEQAAMLAYHHFNGPHPERAIPYLTLAAENAERRYANPVAVEYYRLALGLIRQSQASPSTHGQPNLQQVLQAGRIYVHLGQALKQSGQLADAAQVLAEGWALIESFSSQPALLAILEIESLRELGDVRQREGNLEQAIQHLKAALDIAQNGRNVPETLRRSVIERMAWVYFLQGDLHEAFMLARSEIERADPTADVDPIILASLHNTLGGVLWQQGDLASAMQHVEQGLHLYRDLDYSWGIANAYSNLGVLLHHLGKWELADHNWKQALALREQIGDVQHQALNLYNLGCLHLSMGDHEAARRDITAALESSQQLGDSRLMAWCYVGLARVDIRQAQPGNVQKNAQEALKLAENIGNPEIQVQARLALAVVRAEEDEADALGIAQQAYRLAHDADLWEEQVYALRVWGTLLGQKGDWDQAEARLQESLALCQSRHDPYHQGQTLLEMGRLYALQSGDPAWPAKARGCLEQASADFASLGAQYDLQTAQAILSQLPSLPPTKQ